MHEQQRDAPRSRRLLPDPAVRRARDLRPAPAPGRGRRRRRRRRGRAVRSGVSYRPGARFGGNAIREASRLLRPYNPAQDASPFALAQVADGGDIAVNPFNIHEAVETIEAAADDLLGTGARLMTLGGDHTIALPLLRSVAKKHGPVALLHFDAHLDTWDTYFGAEYTHGTPFRRAVEEGVLDTSALSHVGTRGPLYGKKDLTDDEKMGFGIVTSRTSTAAAPTRSPTSSGSASGTARCTSPSTSTASTPPTPPAPAPPRPAA